MTFCAIVKRLASGFGVLICLLVLAIFAAPDQSWADLFSLDAVWSSALAQRTRSIALGDVDADGDMDLVCGNNEEGTTLFLNVGNVFSRTSAWSSPWQTTYSVALGDVDGDGDLDLACGNENGSTLYLNQGGLFSTTPSWWSMNQVGRTLGTALGDVDGDGDLDLVCSTTNGCILYLNEGGLFTTSPSWSYNSFMTSDVVLGDVDGDGDLDLVCGNFGDSSKLFLNEGGVFSNAPAWLSPVQYTNDVALGDVDGDGDLDLVCGNYYQSGYGQGSTLFLNEGGIFSSTAAWLGPGQMTTGIVLGDVDGDADLDLICGNAGEGTALLINDGGIFATTVGWASSARNTYGLALADVDCDGDLDLLCGNFEEASTLYLNEAEVLSKSPSWSGGPHSTKDVALGDVDGDGDLDLVCGSNYAGQGSMLFRNEGGVFSTSPAWTGPNGWDTRGVVLGDVNDDAKLDLVCGNFGGESRLFLNEGGVYSSPVWSSPLQSTNSVGLGDVNGDGNLDLVCGNYYEGGSALFLNEGGGFSVDAAWSIPLKGTYDVALGDVNDDGDLDVVCGNDNGSTLYLNSAGILSQVPAWSSPVQNTYAVALGDVNGDGDLDLICGNYYGGGSSLFLNDGWVFSGVPAWSGPERYVRSLALGDIDRDGDLDLMCGSDSGSALFLNNAGGLSTVPDWSNPTERTYSVAMGDVDDDGDLDLVSASYYGSSVLVFRGSGNPVFRGNPATPANHLPNNDAFLRKVIVNHVGENLYRIASKVFDVESDPVWIVPEFQFEGAPVWYRASISGYSGNIGPLTTSPQGVEHEFDWDISKIPFDNRKIILRLRAISNPKRVSIIQHVASFCKDIGRVDVRRPELAVSTPSLTFPTVTVGDTVALDMTISNSGNEPLTITTVDLSSSEMRIDLSWPLTLDPHQSITINMYLEPRFQTTIGGPLTIKSNDPISPIKTIPIQTDIRSLQMKTDLLVSALELPLGEAVTVAVTPFSQVRIENGFVYYRSSGTGISFWDSLSLVKYKDNYITSIPGAAIQESGLEYYIRVENSGVFATDPPGAPADSVLRRTVAAPQSIVSQPQPNSGSDFLQGRAVRILVSLPIGAQFIQGAMHYRSSGESLYDTAPLQLEGAVLFAMVGDNLVGPRGLEYWVETQTLTRTLTDPPRTPALNPRSIRVTVPVLSESKVWPASAYRMVTIPLDFGPDFTGTLEALLSDQAAFGPYDPVKWRTFRYLPTMKSYAELPEETASEFIPKPGRAFWLVSSSENRIDTAPVKGLSVATDSAIVLSLDPGWNMIGDPFAFSVTWDSMLVNGLTIVEAESALVEPPVGYTVGKGYRYGREVLEPFEGYWVKNLTDSAVVLSIPPRECVPATGLSETPALAASAPGDGWQIEIHASSYGAEDVDNVLGTAGGALSTWDRHDRSEAPMAPGEAISLYFPHQSWERHKDCYAADIRGVYEALHADELKLTQLGDLWGHIWRFDVAKSFSKEGVGDQVKLEFVGVENVPIETSVYLVDRDLGSVVDLRDNCSYAYHLGRRDPVTETEARFALIVGSKEFVDQNKDELPRPPDKTVLYQNYPNPFNPSTILRYDLARACLVRLTIYNASGALVRVLYDGHRQAGRYEEAWDGSNEKGYRVSSGIYFSRLETSDGLKQTRKLISMR